MRNNNKNDHKWIREIVTYPVEREEDEKTKWVVHPEMNNKFKQ